METAVAMKKRKPFGRWLTWHSMGVRYVLGQKLVSGKIIVNQIKECKKKMGEEKWDHSNGRKKIDKSIKGG